MNSITGGSVQQYVDMRHGILSVDCFELQLYIFFGFTEENYYDQIT